VIKIASTSIREQREASVTVLLKQWADGDSAAVTALVPILHGELRRLAHRLLRRERTGHTLESAALVNEAWLRLVGVKKAQCEDRTRFFALCAQVMRHILIDHARSRLRAKRGADLCRVAVSDGTRQSTNVALVALNDALSALATVDERKAKVVELRYFGGLSIDEVAGVLKVSPETVKRDWKLARLWLARQIDRSAVPVQDPLER
jgi:RNA polymerase sigma-70 factor, ECF subfamily